jgi:hypothetical protein
MITRSLSKNVIFNGPFLLKGSTECFQREPTGS